jgi:hypothetical protein
VGFQKARAFLPDRCRSEHGDYRQYMAALQVFLGSGAPRAVGAASQRDRPGGRAEARLRLAGGRPWRRRGVAGGGLLAEQRVPVIGNPLDNLPADYDQLGARLDNATILCRAGVPLMFTTGTSHNAGLLRQAAGNVVALGAAMERRAGCGDAGPGGRVPAGPGRRQTFVVWTGDPLELSTSAERVMVAGAWVTTASRQTRLLERYPRLDGDEPFGYR